MIAAVLVGTMYAVHDRHPFLAGSFVLAATGAWLAQLGANIVADLGDDLSGAAPFPEDEFTRADAVLAAAALFAGALACGVALGATTGASVYGLGLAGFVLALLYALPPLALSHLGPGTAEAAVFLAFGPLPVAGAYAVQSGAVSAGAIFASIPVGLFAAAIVHADAFARRASDARTGRISTAVALGDERAIVGLWALPVLAWIGDAANVASGDYPSWCLLALLTAPPLVAGLIRLRTTSPVEVCAGHTRATAALASLHGVLIAVGFAIEALTARP